MLFSMEIVGLPWWTWFRTIWYDSTPLLIDWRGPVGVLPSFTEFLRLNRVVAEENISNFMAFLLTSMRFSRFLQSGVCVCYFFLFSLLMVEPDWSALSLNLMKIPRGWLQSTSTAGQSLTTSSSDRPHALPNPNYRVLPSYLEFYRVFWGFIRSVPGFHWLIF